MFSTVPGFDNPKAALRSENEMYESARPTEMGLLYRKPKGESFSSSTTADIVGGGDGCNEGKRWNGGDCRGGWRLRLKDELIGAGDSSLVDTQMHLKEMRLQLFSKELDGKP